MGRVAGAITKIQDKNANDARRIGYPMTSDVMASPLPWSIPWLRPICTMARCPSTIAITEAGTFRKHKQKRNGERTAKINPIKAATDILGVGGPTAPDPYGFAP